MATSIKNFFIKYKYIFLMIGMILAIFSFARNSDPDVYWHIKNGEWIVNNGIPTKDPFSYWNGNFIAHEWLFDIFSYFIFSLFGYAGTVIIANIFFASTIFVACKIANDKKNNMIIPFILGIILVFSNTNIMVMRPAVVSYFLLSIVVLLLEKNKHLWALPIITLICINMHGGMTILIPLTFILYLIDYIYTNWGSINKQIIINRVLVLMLMGITFFITPYGINSFKYGLEVPEYVKTYVNEFDPLITGTSDILLLFLILLPLACMVFTKKARLTDILTMCMAMMMCLTWRRMLGLYNIFFLIYGSQYISDTLEEVKNKFIPPIKLDFKKIGAVTMPFLLIFNLILFGAYGVNMSTITMEGDESSSSVGWVYAPQTILNYIKEQNLDLENNIMFNHYNFGGYFLFHELPVFIDGRCDPYVKEFDNPDIFGDYLKMIDFTDKTIELLKNYNVKYIATYQESNLPEELIDRNFAKELISDEHVILLEITGG